MDERTLFVIFAAITIKSMILCWWDRFKAREAQEPIPTKLRNGVYVPWGPVQKIQHYGWRWTQLWMVYMAVLVLALIYVKIIQPML